MPKNCSRFFAAWLCAALVAGCGGSQQPPVSGRVTMDGKPLANAWVLFQPMGSQANVNPGPTSAGLTDGDGRYVLKDQLRGRPGAMVGKHRVRISSGDPYANEPVPSTPETGTQDGYVPPAAKTRRVFREDIPVRYNQESELEFTVPAGGTDQANFDLNSK
jgi:hypothetical protein